MSPKSFSFSDSALVEDIAKKTWDECDADRSGGVDATELFVAVLLTFDKINKVAPVHIKPPKRKQVTALFNEYDADHSGELDVNEFRRVIRTLIRGDTNNWRTSIWWRVTYLWGLKAVLCPLVAYLIIKAAGHFVESAATWPQGPLAFAVELVFKLTAGRMLL